MRLRNKKGTQKQTVDAIQLFGDESFRDRFDGLVLDLVMRGHTVSAAERIAARELTKGE